MVIQRVKAASKGWCEETRRESAKESQEESAVSGSEGQEILSSIMTHWSTALGCIVGTSSGGLVARKIH